MSETARYFTTINGQPVRLTDIVFITPQYAAEHTDLKPSETMLRVMHEGRLAIGHLKEGEYSPHEADRCVAYSNTPSLHKCDARCQNAKGNQCECSCGGLNHGKGHVTAHEFDWSALEDEGEFSDVRKAPADVAKIDAASQLGMGRDRSIATVARFRCDNCGGSGRWRPAPWVMRSWPCRKCHGKGLVKTDPKVLLARREAAARKAMEARAEYRSAHADVFAWLDAEAAKHPCNGFADSLLHSFAKYGSLTQPMIDAVRRNIQRKAEQAAKPADVVVVGEGFDRIVTAFKAARATGLKYPKFQVGSYVFQPATARSAHPDAIFVKGGRGFHSDYFGRIAPNGDFFAARACGDKQRAEILEICKDPLAAAVMHGKQTGRCSCCGRELENEESVQLGIGPICRRKWGL